MSNAPATTAPTTAAAVDVDLDLVDAVEDEDDENVVAIRLARAIR